MPEVITWYLEMLAAEQLRPAARPSDEACVVRAHIPSPELSRFLYTAVGGQWYWIDRLTWDFRQWQQYVERPEVETWLLLVSGTPAGYIELEAQPGENVEIAYFGVMPRFIGQRLGGYLLSVGVERAWARGARRVWVHTCSLDGPFALANYQARGFRIYDRQINLVDLPAAPPGPWPAANAG